MQPDSFGTSVRRARSARHVRRMIGPAAAALLVAVAAAPALAQQGVVAGTVVASTSLQPLSGAQVVVSGTDLGTLTDAAGRFTFTGVPGTEVTLEVVMIGYRTTEQSARVGDTAVRIELDRQAVALDQIVVTGTPGAQQERALGNVVSTLDASQVLETKPVSTVNQLINGRVAGVSVLSSTGAVGGAAKLRIRGPATLSLSNAPLIYIDGIRVNNDETSGPSNQAFGSSTVSRWNDIDPNNIESIEIIKGPAAATLYGTEAANGVIQIITKKGQQGAPRYNLSIRQGANWLSNPEERLYTNWGMINTDHQGDPDELVSIDFAELQRLRDQFGLDPIFQVGHLQSYDLSVTGGTDVIRYFLSGGYESNEGMEATNRVQRGNARLNLTVVPTEEWRLTGSFGYSKGRTDLPCESGCGGVTWSTYFASPTKVMMDSITPAGDTLFDAIPSPRHGLWSGTPESYYTLVDYWQDYSRFTGSIQLNNNPTSWFSHRLTAGIDQTSEGDNYLGRRDDRFVFFDASADEGSRSATYRNASYTTLDYSGTFEFDLTPAIASSTSFGAQYYRKHFDNVSASGSDFPVEGLTSIDATTNSITGGHTFENNTTVGVFGQEQFSWEGRRFLTFGLRADDNSAFGANFDLVYYPKVSGSWVISEEPFFDFPQLSTLKLRAAYGESGHQPITYAALRTFEPVTGPNDVGTVSPEFVGNPDLGPERSAEIEAGFDAGLFDDRLGIEFTYYDTRTRDAILLRDIAPSSGFHGQQYVNAGEIANSGVEVLLRGTPYISDDVVWDLSVNVSQNNNEVLSLGDVTTEDFVSVGDYVQHRIGYPVGSWFGPKVVSASFEDEVVSDSSMMCDNGAGGSTSCFDEAGQLVAPRVYLGRNTPELVGGINTTVTLFGSLRLFGQLDFKTGFSKLDGNERVRCWFFDLCRENYVPTEFDPVHIAGYQEEFVSSLVSPADFAKLREISASYTLPATWAQRFGARGATITVAGRNLMTWTDYPGLEPEATFNGGGRGGDYTLWEQNVTPQLAQFVATFKVNF